MTKKVQILEIKNNKLVVGLLNDKGQCSNGKCEGCKCSAKVPTMELPIPTGQDFKAGMKVEMDTGHSVALDWMLLIVFPILIIALFLLLPDVLNWNWSQSFMNGMAIVSGFTAFVMAVILLGFIRKNEQITVREI